MNTGAGGIDSLTKAAEAFNRSESRQMLPAVEARREQVIDEFPLKRWEQLPLEDYALGPDSHPGSFCRLMEYGSNELGSIRGGSAAKHIIYQHNSGRWRYPSLLDHLEPRQAWERIRGEFTMMLRRAATRDYVGLDELETLAFGQALVTKALSVYYPDHFLPIFAAAHIRHFTTLLEGGRAYREYTGVRTWQANLELHALVRKTPAFRGWHPYEVMDFFYTEYDPRTPDGDVWKIAPGERARMWDDCRDNAHICIAWDELGDLGQYESDQELKEALDHHSPQSRGGNLRAARQLLAFRDLEPGEQIIANQGKAVVLALGTVTSGYTYDRTRPEYRHLVGVDWDTSYAQELDSPVHAWQQTFAKVPDRLLRRIHSARTPQPAPTTTSKPPAAKPATVSEVPAQVRRVIDALDHKGQVILQGPPGTGKTRLALSTALVIAGQSDMVDAEPDERAAALAGLLTIPDGSQAAQLTMVTFHPSYGYEDFVEGFKPDKASTEPGLNLACRPGLFRRVCAAAQASPQDTFLLVIDEINRGDLPRILGELVTLLELDKRGIPITLPVSEEQQAVPRNVRIIGTMNTADRSIGHLDAAIRRRFATIDVPPDLEAVEGEVEGLSLADFLHTLNDRLRRAFGPDHVIGHAALLREDRPLATAQELATVFRHDIVPLVDDHCLGHPEQLRQIFGTLADPDTGHIAWSSPKDLPGLLAKEFTSPDPDDLIDA